MHPFNPEELKKLHVPSKDSHKGQNGKVLVIAGSKLFHAASLWPLTVASRIVDMVFYSSIAENNELVLQMKEEFRNGIVVPRERLDDYILEADSILIGPGLPRESGIETGDDDTKILTESLLTKYNDKKWVIDGGSLQVISPDVLPSAAIITPHTKEFEKLFGTTPTQNSVAEMAKKYNITILSKGVEDIICSATQSACVKGGNEGMTKGGTGDVLAGLVASLYAKNNAFLSACAASYLNKKAGERLEESMGVYFNASDLADEIPSVMKEFITQ